jgi:N-hydroxyarylamine O-acetyltransferase
LAITGDPYGDRDGEGVSLTFPDLHKKIVERERGGFCFELNGLFGRLLSELGFEVTRVAAMVVGDDGDPSPPANHLSHVVSLDQRYVVDVGLGVPTMRRPIPLDGTARSDAATVEWRVVESDRPDADYATQYRTADAEEWSVRYVFRDVHREIEYFEATCEYLATAPESPFTGDPVASIATDSGHAKLSPTTLTHSSRGDSEERTVTEADWRDCLEDEFGVRYPSR